MIEPPGPYQIFKGNCTLPEGGSGITSRIVGVGDTAPQTTTCTCFCYRKASDQANPLADTRANNSADTPADNSSYPWASNSSCTWDNSTCTQDNDSADTQANHKICASDHKTGHDTSDEASNAASAYNSKTYTTTTKNSSGNN